MARRALELSQLEVALHVGISQSQFSLFEQGYVKLSADLVGAIQHYLRDARHGEQCDAQ
jgi:transcriptional regulator with XRE-family HTH domain